MKLSHASRYAVAALAYLARHKPAGLVASRTIATAEGLPERHLLKCIKPLVRSGVLRSQKGPYGGYALARAPKDVSLLDVVEAVDGPLLGRAEAVARHAAEFDARLQEVCEAAAELVRQRLAAVSIAALAEELETQPGPTVAVKQPA
ncbi:MAG TPA: Rrf2 family transcriptional regulator [Gemmataceae bacterium]|nr:Rrf2 family transcriptional regulator [Gemmataceae bacterium]